MFPFKKRQRGEPSLLLRAESMLRNKIQLCNYELQAQSEVYNNMEPCMTYVPGECCWIITLSEFNLSF